jgi:hypothetical protein
MNVRSNCPHKLTKTADPLARRRSRLGGSELLGVMAAALRSLRTSLVGAAAMPQCTAAREAVFAA